MDEDAIPLEIGLRAVRELRAINERLRWIVILLLIPYVLFALVLLVAIVTGGEATFNVD